MQRPPGRNSRPGREKISGGLAGTWVPLFRPGQEVRRFLGSPFSVGQEVDFFAGRPVSSKPDVSLFPGFGPKPTSLRSEGRSAPGPVTFWAAGRLNPLRILLDRGYSFPQPEQRTPERGNSMNTSPGAEPHNSAPPAKYPNRVRQIRKSTGMSAKLVAERTGIPLPTYSGIERGKLVLTVERALAIAPVLEVANPADLSASPLVPAAALARNHGPKGQRPEELQQLLDTDELIKLCLSIPKRRRKLAADLIRVLLRAWE